MIKSNKKSVLMGMMAGALFFSSCEDKFTEQDLLNAQQQVDYTLQLVDLNSSPGDSVTNLKGTKVSLTQGADVKTVEADENGFVRFGKVNIGNVILKVDSDKYLSSEAVVDLVTSNSKISQMVTRFPVLATTEGNTVIVKGKVEIESDLTNDTREKAPAGTILEVEFSGFDDDFLEIENHNSGGSITGWKIEKITTTVKEDGTYEVVLPATPAGVDYSFKLQPISLNQALAISGLDGETEISPRVENIPTEFKIGDNYLGHFIPYIPNVLLKIDDKFIGYASVNNDGQITWANVESEKQFTPNTEYDATIEELKGKQGTGASVKVYTDANGYIDYASVISRGSEYTSGDVNIDNYSISNNTSVEAVKGSTIQNRNFHYGFGAYRSVEVND